LCILLYADMFFLVPVFQVTMEPWASGMNILDM
jgi:hypothetical protein